VKKRKATSELWPIHFKPQDDELLSSWLVRLAIAHGLKPRDFYSIEVPDKPDFLIIIDGTDDSRILEWVSRKTGTHIDNVRATTFQEYGGHIFFKYNLSPVVGGDTFEWVMPISYKKNNRFFGLQFCPYCLLDDEEPYFRRKWQLAFITHCEKHRAVLSDRCPQCTASVNFTSSANDFKNEILPNSMVLCRSCNFDLRQAASTSTRCAPNPEEIQYQEHLVSLMSDPWPRNPRPDYLNGYSYFRTLHQLIKTLAFEDLGRFLRTTIRQSYGLPASLVERADHYCLERLSVNERRELLDLARLVIKDWPGPFATLEALIKEVMPRHRLNQLRYLTENVSHVSATSDWS
jgi:hypothetical protein